jgi:adenylate cyclase
MAADPVERKLAAILSADVVGYSRLMAEDEAATIRTISDYREAIAMRVRKHRGRVVDAPGDNVLAEFPTALEAVRCALEVQGVLRALNSSLPAERRMDFRIGIHMGDVATEGERIYGDGVNIAARLEGLAEAGGVCISATVHEQVRNKLDAGFLDLGDQTVKNIPEQVRVYRVQPQSPSAEPAVTAPALRSRPLRTVGLATATALLLVGVVLWATWPAPLGILIDVAGVSGPPVNPALPDKPSIAVLPFTNLSGDPEQEYFSDGLTEDVTSELARLPYLFVIARNSAFMYKGQQVNIEDVGRELGVRYVLEGSVRRVGDRVRVTAQLIDATTGGHVWSQRYDRELSDIFAIQSDISEEILAAAGVEIRAAEGLRLARKPAQSFTATDALWRGIYHFNRVLREDNEEARRLFERAIELDPEPAPPYAFLGNTYLQELSQGWSTDAALLDRAEALGSRAVELDPSLASGHITLAFANFLRDRPERTIAEAERAIELEPNESASHAFRGLAMARRGRFLEATRSIRQSLRLNPRPNSGLLMITTYVNWGAGRIGEAVGLLERIRSENRDNVIVRVALARFYEREGRHEEAQIAVREILGVTPDLTAERAMQLIPGWEELLGPEEFALSPDDLRAAGLP